MPSKKSPSASLETMLSSLKKYFKEIHYQREIWCLGHRWETETERKERNKAASKIFCLHRAGESQGPTNHHHGDSSSLPLLHPLALQ